MHATLTDDGLKNVRHVITVIFQYLDMIRREGPQRYLFDEFAAVADATFRFSEEVEPIDHCETVALEMHHFEVRAPPKRPQCPLTR